MTAAGGVTRPSREVILDYLCLFSFSRKKATGLKEMRRTVRTSERDSVYKNGKCRPRGSRVGSVRSVVAHESKQSNPREKKDCE